MEWFFFSPPGAMPHMPQPRPSCSPVCQFFSFAGAFWCADLHKPGAAAAAAAATRHEGSEHVGTRDWRKLLHVARGLVCVLWCDGFEMGKIDVSALI